MGHVEEERRRRVRLMVWAYAYELANDVMVSDAYYDSESYKVDLSISCDYGNKTHDAWWREHFMPDTGQWIQCHPDLGGVHKMYLRVRAAVGPGLIVE